MEFRKSLLKVASLLALTAAGTAAGQSSADASIATSEHTATTAAKTAVHLGDPLFELVSRTNGSLASRSVEDALREMYSAPSSAQVEAIRGLLAGLSGLGASSDTLAQARLVLIDLISTAANIGEDVREAALDELQGEVSTFKLAQQQPKRRNRREPGERGQVGGPPGAAS